MHSWRHSGNGLTEHSKTNEAVNRKDPEHDVPGLSIESDGAVADVLLNLVVGRTLDAAPTGLGATLVVALGDNFSGIILTDCGVTLNPCYGLDGHEHY